jgi:REP element-mobilizing transposase RayT
MKYNPDIHHRRSIRLKDYDYSSDGIYFVTICTYERELLFEKVDCKKIVEKEWYRTAVVRSIVHLDEFICMPNHIHGIIVFIAPCRGEAVPRPDLFSPDLLSDFSSPVLSRPDLVVNKNAFMKKRATHRVAPTQGIRPNSLGAIIGQFKTITTKRINQFRGTMGCPVWQRNYYERVIRNENELNRIGQYIRDNPSNWETDEETPNRRGDS